MPPVLRAVTLDAAGTLIRVAEPVGHTYAALARRFGASPEPEALDARFRAAFAGAGPLAFPDASPGGREASERRWWAGVVSRVVGGREAIPDFDAYFAALWSHYASASAWRLYPEVADVLDALAGRRLRLAVVSNFDSRLPGILDGLGIADRFAAVVHSSAVGAAKPDPAIFRSAVEALGVEPGTTLHVGDRADADLAGARGAGLRAVLVDRRTTLPRARAQPPGAVVASLRDLIPILEDPETSLI